MYCWYSCCVLFLYVSWQQATSDEIKIKNYFKSLDRYLQAYRMMDSVDGKRSSKSENLEVTGVSRSGRVRKKSSKLMDFESPDEVENKYKRKSHAEMTPRAEKPRKTPKMARGRPEDEDDDMYDQMEPYQNNPQPDSDSEGDTYRPAPEEYEHHDIDDEDEEDNDDDDFNDGNLVVDEKAPTQSLYMMEKNKRKMVFKDGKVVATPKTQRKDKGRSRFTAYMMWAKEVRQALSKQFPEMDFSTMARRLSEMWATVPNTEREHWKRKARREGLKKAKAKSEAPLMPSRKFINKKGGPIAPLHNSQVVLSQKPPVAEQSSPSKIRKISETSPTSGSLGYKVTGLAPIDVAAHLKLLGESLSIIGERLQEHEGQIAVSGSLSVLLDSLLCAMGPLLCLTQQVERMQTGPELLAKILQNTAYIMPGLG